LPKWHGNPVVVFGGSGGDAQPGVSPKRFLNGNANHGRAFFDSIGQSEKNSVRVYVFRLALKLRHCSTQAALRIRADEKLMHRSKRHLYSIISPARATNAARILRSCYRDSE
jgi:hypothetical protein